MLACASAWARVGLHLLQRAAAAAEAWIDPHPGPRFQCRNICANVAVAVAVGSTAAASAPCCRVRARLSLRLVQVAEKLTPVQAALAKVKSDASLETINKLVRNVAQNPAEEKFRKVRLTNEKIAAVLVQVEGAKQVMLEMGWVEEGEFLVLPARVQLSFNKEVRDIEEAKTKLKKEQEQAMLLGACKKQRQEDPEMKRLREQMEADRKERAANPITTGAKAQNLGNGANVVQFQPPPSSG